jgi:pantoate--beta-alanine ligase
MTRPPTPPTSPGAERPAVARSVADLRGRVAGLRDAGRRVALVPTMGALHEGHLSLVRTAAAEGHAVVVSVFVNPAQFGPAEDLASYPRDEERDLALAAAAGAVLAFVPSTDEVYPPGFGTAVTLDGPSAGLEGAARPHHFAGVATVVLKLLLAVRPDRVVFGQKDAQQVAVVRRLMRDVHLDDVELVVGPIVREPDGLAMSSRNAYLGPEDRRAATALVRGLEAAAALARAGEAGGPALERVALAVMATTPGVAPEYAALVDPDTFARATRPDGRALMCVAARVGSARLIDNLAMPVPAPAGPASPRPPSPARRPAPATRTVPKSNGQFAEAGLVAHTVPPSGER